MFPRLHAQLPTCARRTLPREAYAGLAAAVCGRKRQQDTLTADLSHHRMDSQRRLGKEKKQRVVHRSGCERLPEGPALARSAAGAHDFEASALITAPRLGYYH